MLTLQFQPQSSYIGCSWVAQFIGEDIYFRNIANSCFNDSSDSLAEVQCTEDNNGIITTTLHVTSALNEQTDEFSVRCLISNSAPVTIQTRTITIAGKNNAIVFSVVLAFIRGFSASCFVITYHRGPQIVGRDPTLGRDTFDFGSQKL